MNSRSAVAFGSPQDIEVLVDGTWLPGAMLGWRHDDTGDCEAWVQLRSDTPGVVEGAGTWVGLADVRLPERHLALAPAPATATAAVPAVADAAASATGRPRPSRRHGADLTAEQPAVGAGAAGRHRAPAAAGAGRHRAVTTETPAIVVDAVADPADRASSRPADRVAPVEATVVAPVVTAPVAAPPAPSVEHDLLTRPIRLGDLVPHSRGGRPPVRPSA